MASKFLLPLSSPPPPFNRNEQENIDRRTRPDRISWRWALFRIGQAETARKRPDKQPREGKRLENRQEGALKSKEKEETKEIAVREFLDCYTRFRATFAAGASPFNVVWRRKIENSGEIATSREEKERGRERERESPLVSRVKKKEKRKKALCTFRAEETVWSLISIRQLFEV